jgi:hypothetical protein
LNKSDQTVPLTDLVLDQVDWASFFRRLEQVRGTKVVELCRERVRQAEQAGIAVDPCAIVEAVMGDLRSQDKLDIGVIRFKC